MQASRAFFGTHSSGKQADACMAQTGRAMRLLRLPASASSACLLPWPQPPMKYVGIGAFFSPVM